MTMINLQHFDSFISGARFHFYQVVSVVFQSFSEENPGKSISECITTQQSHCHNDLQSGKKPW